MDRTEARGLGAPSSPFARHHRAGSVASMWESRTDSSLRSLPRRGLITPAELRRTPSRTAAAPAFPMPGTGVPDTSEGGSHDHYQASPSHQCAGRRSRSMSIGPGATALVRGRWRLAAVTRGRSAMCRIGQDLKPPPRIPSQDRIRAWGLRGHLPYAAQPSWGLGALIAAIRTFTRNS